MALDLKQKQLLALFAFAICICYFVPVGTLVLFVAYPRGPQKQNGGPRRMF
jgi:hypothetical protein